MKEDDVVVVSSDSEEDEEHVWIRKSSNPQYQLLLEKIKPILFYQVQPGHKPSDGFPYAKFQEFAKDFKKSLALVNVKSTRAFIWKNLLRWLVSMKLCFDSVADIIDDKNYNLILTEFMAQYVDYKCQLHSSITDANEAGRISNEIVIILSLIFNGWVPGILMTLLKIQVVDEYRLILFPIFKKYLSKQHVHGTLDLISYLRLILCFRKWKKLTHFKEDKELINEIAVGKSAKALRSDLIDLSSDSTDNDPVLPKTVPPVDKNNRGFFNLTGLIGFAAKNQFGTRILLINRTLELEDTVEEFFKRYYEYINRDAPKLPDWSRVDLIPVLVEDLTRSTSPIQHPPQSTASSATSQTANKNNGIQGTKAVDQHLSSDCDKPKLSISNKNNSNLNSQNLSRSYKNSPHNRIELESKLKDVVELDDSDSDRDTDTNKTDKSITETVTAFEKRLTTNLDKLKERAVTIDSLINRVNSNVPERVQNPEVVEILIDDEDDDTDTVPAAQQEVAIADPPKPPITMPVPPPPLQIAKPAASERKRCEHGIVSSTTSFDCSNTPDGLANSELHETTRDVSTPISDDDGGFGVPNRFSILQRSSSKVVEEATSSTNEIPKRTQSSGVVVFSVNASQPRRSISSSPCSTRPSSPSPDRCSANIFPSSTIRSRSINRPAAGAAPFSRPLSSLSNREQPTCSGGCVPKPVPAARSEEQLKQDSAPIESSKNQDSPTCSRFVLTRDASVTPSTRSTETSPAKSTDPNDEATTFEVSDLLKNISGFIGDSQETYGGFESPQERSGPDKSPRKIYNTSVSIENEPNDNASFDVIFPQRNDDGAARTISFHTEAKKQNQHLDTNDKSASKNDVDDPKKEQELNQHNKDAQESPYYETDLEDPEPNEDICEGDELEEDANKRESISSPLKTEKTTDQVETVNVIQQEVSPKSNESKEVCPTELVEKEVLLPEQYQLNSSSGSDDANKMNAKAVSSALSDEDSSSIDRSGELIDDDIESPDYELIAPKQKSQDFDTSSTSVEDDKNTQKPSEVPRDKKTSIASNELTKTNDENASEEETIVPHRDIDVDSIVIDRQKVESDSGNKTQDQETVGDNLKDCEAGSSTSTDINKIVNYDHDYVTASNTKNDQSKSIDTKSNTEGSNSVNKILETFIGRSNSSKNERDVIRTLKNLEAEWSSIDSSNDPEEQIIEELTYFYDAMLTESEIVAENLADNISKHTSEEQRLEIQSIVSAVENLPDNIAKQTSQEEICENKTMASAVENLPDNIAKQTSEEESGEKKWCSLNLNEAADEKDVEVQQLLDNPETVKEDKSDETVEKSSTGFKENNESEAMSADVVPDDEANEKSDAENPQMNQPTVDEDKETREQQFDATDEKSHEKEISLLDISLSTISDEEISECFDLLSTEELPDQMDTFENVENVSPVSNQSKTDNDTLQLIAEEDFGKKADTIALLADSVTTTATENDTDYEPAEVPQEEGEEGFTTPRKGDNEANEETVNGSQNLVEQTSDECQLSETDKDYEATEVPQEEEEEVEEGLMIPSKDDNEEKVVEQPSDECQTIAKAADPSIGAASSENTKSLGEEVEEFEQTPVRDDSSQEINSKSQEDVLCSIPDENKESTAEAEPIHSKEANDVVEEVGPESEELIPESESAQPSDPNLVETEISNQITDTKSLTAAKSNDNSDITSETVENSSKPSLFTENPQEMTNSIELELTRIPLPSSVVNDFDTESLAGPRVVSCASTALSHTINKIAPMKMLRVRIPRLPKKELLKFSPTNLEHRKSADISVKQEVIVGLPTQQTTNNKPSENDTRDHVENPRVDLSATHQGTSEQTVVAVESVPKGVKNELKIEELEQEGKATLSGSEPTSEQIPLQQQAKTKKQSVKNKKVKKHKIQIEQTDDGQTDIKPEAPKPEELTNSKSIPLTDNYEETAKLNEPEQVQVDISNDLVAKAQCIEKSQGDEAQDPDKTSPQKKKVLRVRLVKLPTDNRGSTDDLQVCPSSSVESIPQMVQKTKVNGNEAKPKSHSIENILAPDVEDVPVTNEDPLLQSPDTKQKSEDSPSIAFNPNEPTQHVINDLEQISETKTEESKPKLPRKNADKSKPKETLEKISEKLITSKAKTAIVITDKEKDSLLSTSSEIKEEPTLKKTKTPPLPNSKPAQSAHSIKKSSTSEIAKSVECQTEPKQAITYKRPPSIDPTKQPIQNILQRKDELVRTRNQEVFTEIRLKDHENSIEPDSSQEVAKELQRTEATALEDESLLSTKVQVGDLEEPSIISDSEIGNNSPVRLESDSAVVFYQFRDTIDEEVLGITSQDSNQTPPYYNDENGTPVMDEKNLAEEETPPQKITCLSAIKVPTTDLPEITSNVILREPKLIVPSPSSIEVIDESVRSFSTVEDENLEVWNQQLPFSGQFCPSPSCTPKSSLCNPKNRKQKNPRKVRFLLKRDDKSLKTGDDKSFSSEDLNAAAILTSFKNFAVLNPVPKSRKKLQPTRITRSTRSKSRKPQPTLAETICSSDILDSSKAFEKRLISPTIEHQIELRQSNSSSDSDDAGKLVIDLDAKRSTKPKSLEKQKTKARAFKNKKCKSGRKASCSKKLAKTEKLLSDPLNIENDLDVGSRKPTELVSTEKRFQLKPSSISYKSNSLKSVRHKLNMNKETWLKNLSLRKTSKSLDSESKEIFRGDSILKRALSEPVMSYHCHEALQSINLFKRNTDDKSTKLNESESAVVKESLETFAKVDDDNSDPLSFTKDSEETEKPKLVLHIRRLPTPTGDNILEANLKPAKKHTKKMKRKKAELPALEDQTTFKAVLVEDSKPVDAKSKRTKTDLGPLSVKEEDNAVQIKKAASSGKAKSNEPKVCQLEEVNMFETVFIEDSIAKTKNCKKPIAKCSSKNKKASKASEEEVLGTKSLSKKSKAIQKCSQKAKKFDSKIAEAIVSEPSVTTAPEKPKPEVEGDTNLTQVKPQHLIKTKGELKLIAKPIKETAAKKPKSKNNKSETKSISKSINKTFTGDSSIEIAEEPKIVNTLIKEVKSEPAEEVKPKESVKLVSKLRKSSNEHKATVEKSKSTSNVGNVEESEFDDVTEDPQEEEKGAEKEPVPTNSKKAKSDLKLIKKKATIENETAVEKSISKNIEQNSKSSKKDSKVEIVDKANDVDVPSEVDRSDGIPEISRDVKTEISKETKPIDPLIKRASLGLRLNAKPIKKSSKEAKTVLDESKSIKKSTKNSKSVVKTIAAVKLVDESKIVIVPINEVKSEVFSEPTQEVKVGEEKRPTSPILNKAKSESKLTVKSILKSPKEPEPIVEKSESKSISTPRMPDVEILEVLKIVATPSKRPQQDGIRIPPVDEKVEDLEDESPKKPIHVEILEDSKKVISPSKKVKSVTFSEEVKLIAKSNKTETVIDNLKPSKIVKSALKSTLKVVSESIQELKKDAIEESQGKVLVESKLTAKLEVNAALTKPVSECPKTDAVEMSNLTVASSESLKKEENVDVHDETPVKIDKSELTPVPKSNEKPLKAVEPSETALSTEKKTSLSDKTNLEAQKAQETESSGTSVLDEDATQVILTTKKAIDELVSLMKSTNEPKNPVLTEELVDEVVVPCVDPVKDATLEEKSVTSAKLEEEKSDSSINHNVVSETKTTISIEQTFRSTGEGSIKIDKILDELVASGSCPASISADTELSNTTTTVAVEPAPITPINSISVSPVDFEPLCVPFSKALDSPTEGSPKNDEQISTNTIETPTKKEDEVKRALDISISKIFGSKLTDIENNVDSDEPDKKDNNNDRLKKSVQRATKRKRPSLDGDQSQVNFPSGFQRRRSNSTSDMTSIVPTTESIEGFEIDSEILPNKSADSEAKKAQLLIDSLEFERESLFFELNAANQVPLNASTKVEQRQIESDKKPEQFGFVENPLRQGTSVKASDCMLSGNRGQDDEDKLRSFYMNECQWGEVHNFESPDEHELDDLFDGFCLPLQTPLIPGSENVSGGTSKIDKNSNFTLSDIDAIINPKKNENNSRIVDVQLALATDGVISLNQEGISTGDPSGELERESTLPEILVNEEKPQQSDAPTKPANEEPTTTGSSPLAKAFTKKIMASLDLTNKSGKTPEKDRLAKETTSESKMKCRSTPFWKQINKNPDNCLDEIFEVNSTKNSSTSPSATESDSKVAETNTDKTETSETTVSTDLSTDDLFDRLKNETTINSCGQIKPKSKEEQENSTSDSDANSQSSSKSTSSIKHNNETKKSIAETMPNVTTEPSFEKKAETDVNPEYYNPYAKKPSRQSHITKSKPKTEEGKSKHKVQTSKSGKPCSSANIKRSQSPSLQKLSSSTAPELKKSLPKKVPTPSTVVQVPGSSEKLGEIAKPTETAVRPSLKRSLSDDKKLQEPPSKVLCTKIPASVPIQDQTLEKSEPSLPEPSKAKLDSVATIQKNSPQPQPIVVQSAKSDPSPVIQKKLTPPQQSANQSNPIVRVQKIPDPLHQKTDQYTKSSTPVQVPPTPTHLVPKLTVGTPGQSTIPSPNSSLQTSNPLHSKPDQHIKSSTTVQVPPTPPHPIQKLSLGTPGLSTTPSPNSSSTVRSLQTCNPLHQKTDQYTKSSTPVQVPPTPPHPIQKLNLGTPGLSTTPSQNSSSSVRSLQTGNRLHQKPDQYTKSSTPVQVPTTPPHPIQKFTLGTPGLSNTPSPDSSSSVRSLHTGNPLHQKPNQYTKSSTPVQVPLTPSHPIQKLSLGTPGLSAIPSPNSSSSVRSLHTGNPLYQKPDQYTKSSTPGQVPPTPPHPIPKSTLGTTGLSNTPSPNSPSSVRPLQTSFPKAPSSKPITSPSPQSQNRSSHSPMNSFNPISEHSKLKPVPVQKTNFPNQQKLPTPIHGTPSSTPTSFGPSRSNHQSSRTPSTVTSLPKVMAYPSTEPTPMSPLEQDLARVRTELKKIQDEVSRLPESDYNFRIYRQRKALLADLENKQQELEALKQKHYHEMKKVNELKKKKENEKQQILKAQSERGGEHQHHHGHHHNPHNSLKRKHNDPSADATQRTRSLHQLPGGSASAKSSHRDRTNYVNKFGELDKYKFTSKGDTVIDEHSQAKRLPPWDPKPVNAEEIIQTLLTK